MKSNPHCSFCQVHRGRPLDDNKFCMDSFLQVQASCPKPADATGFQLHPICSSDPLWSKEWLPCLVSSSRLSYERVKVTQGLPCIPPGVVLDKTPNTSKKKLRIRRLTSSILNPSSLMLTELQKSPTSFDSFKKGVNLWLRPSSRL